MDPQTKRTSDKNLSIRKITHQNYPTEPNIFDRNSKLIEHLTHSREIHYCTKNIEIKNYWKKITNRAPYRTVARITSSDYLICISISFTCHVFVYISALAQKYVVSSLLLPPSDHRGRKNEFHPTTNKRRTKKAMRFMPTNYHSFKNRCQDALHFELQPLIAY